MLFARCLALLALGLELCMAVAHAFIACLAAWAALVDGEGSLFEMDHVEPEPAGAYVVWVAVAIFLCFAFLSATVAVSMPWRLRDRRERHIAYVTLTLVALCNLTASGVFAGAALTATDEGLDDMVGSMAFALGLALVGLMCLWTVSMAIRLRRADATT